MGDPGQAKPAISVSLMFHNHVGRMDETKALSWLTMAERADLSSERRQQVIPTQNCTIRTISKIRTVRGVDYIRLR